MICPWAVLFSSRVEFGVNRVGDWIIRRTASGWHLFTLNRGRATIVPIVRLGYLFEIATEGEW